MHDRYIHIAQLGCAFQWFARERDVQRDASAETSYGIPKNIATVIREIVWEEDALGIDVRSHLYKEADDPVESAEPRPDPVVPKPISDSGSSSPSDTADSPIENEPEQYVEFDADDSIGSHFAPFTYWKVESGPHVSYTLNPLYSKRRANAITLLEDAEAFVATSIWGNKNTHKMHQAPRHLLVQAAQVASRAFFDPDYRDYLQSSHAS
ncbi:hypothetical protein, conserved [Babesia bigemina]|uniref:Uncharacterized protein n=1 Tax=Babesia bigemina TaxID=5866 RepID=A0A061DB74_BABBI|nr:hypothetical protein, conserved [Babesia bigemina]CDR97936.1 hypothetical protein, conserved [Babesia bigemina]|eukprot:XP_012770122.1 hypothetical protein, conserved [Babesia bigemina]